PSKALMRGIPTLVSEGINATGTGKAHIFSVLKTPGPDAIVKCQSVGTFTTFNGTIEATLDGGTTWSTFTNFDFVVSNYISFIVAAGVSYRFNVANLAQTVAPNISAVLS